MADFEVHGAQQFLDLSKALKHAGRTDLRKELHKGIQRAARPLIPLTRAEARRRLPKRGGLADRVAREPQRVQVRTGADTAGVRIVVGRKQGGARSANQGVIRHPVFGRDEWVEQKVEPGWFDAPILATSPVIRRHVERSMQDVVNTIVRSVGG